MDGREIPGRLCPLPSNTTGQLDVLGHDGNTLGMDGTQVGIFKETDQVCLRCLLQGHHSRGLEPKVSLEVLGNFTDEPLEGKFTDEELCALLIPSNLPEGNSSRPVPMRLFDSSRGWSRFTSSFGGQLLTRGFPSSRLACCLLGSGHV